MVSPSALPLEPGDVPSCNSSLIPNTHTEFRTSTNAVGTRVRQAYNPTMKHLTLPIVVEADSDGYFVSCSALQGCYSQGDTYEEALENIKDAIRLHIEDRLDWHPQVN